MKSKSARRWANDINFILNKCDGSDRFPVDVKRLAFGYSKQAFPNAPITLIEGASLPGFEGALLKAPSAQAGWGIVYNDDTNSPGRINFTLAHEFGHYLLHRDSFPDGIQCSVEDMTRWDSKYRLIEREANEFAANLLMPLDDFRSQIDSRERPSLDDLGNVAERYGVSLMAVILRWLEYTKRRAILVKSLDGFIDWSWSSEPALRSGCFFKTTNSPPIELPKSACVLKSDASHWGKTKAQHASGIWLKEPCLEYGITSDRYDFSLSLLHLPNLGEEFEDGEDLELDTFKFIAARTRCYPKQD